MILAETTEEREKALAKLIPYQKGDFKAMYKELKGLPMTVRYLDPPLHEFLPKEEKEIESLAKSLGMSFDELKERIESLKEFNPMMGHRGCRLDITYPEIAEMQTRAVIEAALNVTAEGINVTPEIMIPLVGDVKELHYVKELVDNTAKEVMEEKGKEISYKVGTMIEVPRAALLSGQLAKEAEFFSFGTNDLTQMTFGFSRDDAAKFLNDFYDKKIFEQDPFAKLDETGVGKLMEIAIYQARNVKENIKLGICGEHAGNPASIKFCKQIGLNYVSCSPFRVPVARLAAAQAEIETNDK
jgi:pyruvate,orthophosphate dikinase